MTLEMFFEKFDQFTDAPNAVAKMRELVLHMAVRGKLIPQDLSDESGRDLIARIDREMKDEVRLRRASPLPELPVECIQFELPEQWVWARFRDVAVIASNLVNPNDYLDFIHLAPDNIEKGNGVLLRCATVGEDKVISSNHRFRAGQIVYSKIRPNLAKAVVVNFDGLCSADMYPVDALIDANYLHRYMLSESFLIQAVKTDTRVAMPKINQAELNAIAVPVPPLAEQKRIVAKVDELMALCDRLEAQQRERETQQAQLARAAVARFADAPNPTNIELLFHKSYSVSPADLRKTILTLAVQGKLVPQDPNDEPVVDCLARLELKTTAVPENGSDSDDDSSPPLWTRVRFEDVALIAGGVTLGRKLGDRKTVTLPYLRVANVKRGELDLRVIKEVSIVEDELDRYALLENDLLMTEGGDWDKVGRAAIWRGEIPYCLHQNHVFRARMRSPKIGPRWFELYFNSPPGRTYFESASKQTTNLASINMRQVRGCPVPLPPLAEQRRIVAKVDQLMALVDQLETQLTASRAAAATLIEALVAELTTTL